MGVLELVLAAALQLQPAAAIDVVVSSDVGPLARAQVVVSGRTVETGADGRVTIQVPPGSTQITVIKAGFNRDRYCRCGHTTNGRRDARTPVRH